MRSTFTFWRFPIQIQLGDNEICIKYSINGGMQLSFFVPARHQNMRWAAHSVRSTKPVSCIFCPLLLSVMVSALVWIRTTSKGQGFRVGMTLCGLISCTNMLNSHFMSLWEEVISYTVIRMCLCICVTLDNHASLLGWLESPRCRNGSWQSHLWRKPFLWPPRLYHASTGFSSITTATPSEGAHLQGLIVRCMLPRWF